MFGVPYEIRTRVIAVKGRCPRPLDEGDFGATFLFGGGKRDRTADLLHAMQALSQLSYGPKGKEGYFRSNGLTCQGQNSINCCMTTTTSEKHHQYPSFTDNIKHGKTLIHGHQLCQNCATARLIAAILA